jgi:hypothetical protein
MGPGDGFALTKTTFEKNCSRGSDNLLEVLDFQWGEEETMWRRIRRFFFWGGGVWGGVLEGPSFHFPNPPPLEAGGCGQSQSRPHRSSGTRAEHLVAPGSGAGNAETPGRNLPRASKRRRDAPMKNNPTPSQKLKQTIAKFFFVFQCEAMEGHPFGSTRR